MAAHQPVQFSHRAHAFFQQGLYQYLYLAGVPPQHLGQQFAGLRVQTGLFAVLVLRVGLVQIIEQCGVVNPVNVAEMTEPLEQIQGAQG